MKTTRPLFVAACAGMLLFGMSILSLGTVNAFLIERFGLDPLGVASLAGLLPFGILAGSIIFGPIVDRYGYKMPLAAASLCILAGFETIAAASSFLPVQGAFFAIGLGGGVLNGGTNALVADISAENRGGRLSILGVFFGLGALGMPMVTAVLLKSLAPETIIAGFGWAILLPTAYFLLLPFPAPKQSRGFPITQGLTLLRDGTLLLLSLILFFESAAEGVMNNWSSAYLRQSVGMDTDGTLFLLTLFSASLTAARLVLGGILKRVSQGFVLVVSLVTAISGALFLGLFPAPAGATAGMVLIGIGFAAAFPVVLGIIGGLYPALSGTAFGIALVIALSGNTIVNVALGAASGAWGIGIFPWYLLCVLAGLGVVLGLALRSLTHRHTAGMG